jgi:hypothetical protein
MPSWLTNPEAVKTLAFLPVPILLSSLLIWIVFSIGPAERMRATWENLLILFCFSSLGLTVGILAASSSASAVPSLLPAVLSLVGGLAAYLVSRQAPEKIAPADRLITAAAVTALALTLFIGALIGADLRDRADAYRESAPYKKHLIDIKREVEEYEQSLAIKDAVPDPEGKLDQVLAEIERRQKQKGR